MSTLRCLMNVQTGASVILFKSILSTDFPLSVNGNSTLLVVQSKTCKLSLTFVHTPHFACQQSYELCLQNGFRIWWLIITTFAPLSTVNVSSGAFCLPASAVVPLSPQSFCSPKEIDWACHVRLWHSDWNIVLAFSCIHSKRISPQSDLHCPLWPCFR